MAKIYADLIKEGLWTVEQVPTKWKGQVIALLEV